MIMAVARRPLLPIAVVLALMCGADIYAQVISRVTPLAASGTLNAINAGSCTITGTGCVILNVGGYTGVGVQVTGTCGTCTLAFESSVDGTNWVATNLTPAASTTPATSTTATGVWFGSVVGQRFRVRMTARASGSFVVTVRATLMTASKSAAGGGGGTPGGSDTQVQFNDGGAFGGDAGLTYDKATDILQARTRLNIQTDGVAGSYLTSRGLYILDNAGGEILRLVGTDPDNNDANSHNLYLGYQAGMAQPTDNISAGIRNTGIGAHALQSITEGSSNTSVGYFAGGGITTGSNNNAFGNAALVSVTTGSFNIGLGGSAGSSIDTGLFNMAIGGSALGSVTSGWNNVGVGANSGYSIVTGSDNIAIGQSSGPTTGALSNTIAIGSNAAVSASNRMVVGDNTITDVYLGSEGGSANVHAGNMPKIGAVPSIGGSPLTAGTCASTSTTVTGATNGMVAVASPTTYPGDGAIWMAYVSAADTVTVKVCALVLVTPTASTYQVRVIP